MKKVILVLISAFLCSFLSAQNMVSADSIWNKIRIETVKGANTASRVGTAGQLFIHDVRDTLSNFALTSGVNTLINDTLSYYPLTSTVVKLTTNQTIAGKKTFSDTLKVLNISTPTGIPFINYTPSYLYVKRGDTTYISLEKDMVVYNGNGGRDGLTIASGYTGLKDYLSNEDFIKSEAGGSYFLNGGDAYLKAISDTTYSYKVFKPIGGIVGYSSTTQLSDSFANYVTIANPQLILGLKTFQNGIQTRIVDENELSVFGGDQFYTAIQSGGKEYISAYANGEVLVYDSTGNFTIKCDDDSIRFYKPTNIPIAYGGLYVSDGVTAQNIPTGMTYTKITAFADCDTSYQVTCVADSITILVAGTYQIEGSFSMSSGTNNVNTYGALFVNGVEQSNIHFERKIGTQNDVGCVSITGRTYLSVGDDLSYRMRTDDGGTVAITIHYANLGVNLLRKH